MRQMLQGWHTIRLPAASEAAQCAAAAGCGGWVSTAAASEMQQNMVVLQHRFTT
jgi:hypothetical protein